MHDDRQTDGELIAASLANPEMFSAIFDRHAEAVFQFVARRAGRWEAAEVTGEVFARAFVLRSRFDGSRISARPWLYGIAYNVIGDHLRRRDVRRRRTAVAGLRMLDRPVDPYPQVEADVDARAVGDTLWSALRKLRRADRETILLYALEDLSYHEVAEALGIPIGTVRSRLSRARRQLRELLPPHLQNIVLGNGFEGQDS